ncbi:MAG: indolepyruvate ferredoxin oxidoreductase subunit alpha [Candidatus Staskawiczbacteria bacterium]|nr:indolepyruvate ferredoxin oxidoreductase subunit alpha [Candidatus Staskawiczbacteria bacterium]
MEKEILLGDEAIVRGALEAGVDFVSGYPGCPSAEIGDEFGKIAREHGIYAEWSTNEKVALESAIGASFSGLKSLVNMKSFGLNVCSDSLFPLAYTGTKAPMVIVVADDPSCWSSAQSEQDSRGYGYLFGLPILEPSDPEECYGFTKLGFEISEKFQLPVILRITTRVAHQRMPVKINKNVKTENQKEKGIFIKDYKRFATMPPRVLEMKKELLEKIEKLRVFSENSKANRITENPTSGKLGIIASGVGFLHTIEAIEELGLNIPVLKLGFFHPLPVKKIAGFIKNLKQVLIAEEVDPYLEKEIKIIAKEANPKIQVFGRDILSGIGELNPDKIISAIVKIKKIKIKNNQKTPDIKFKIPKRTARLCDGCPYWHVFPVVKRIAPEGTVFGGDIGCNMIAGFSPHNIQDYLFSMGASMGISHGISKAVSPSFAKNSESKQKVISIIGDGTFFHAGIPGLINAVYNKSNPLIIILDNRITAMTGHQQNPGMGKTVMGDDVEEIKIEEIAKSCGVKNIKVLDPINTKELEGSIREFLEKEEVSVIICRRICALLARRQKKQNE